MNLKKRPYLIIPKLIQQPTWGGTYIPYLKSWSDRNILKNKRIGQSYELFGNSKIIFSINNSSDPGFLPEIGWADKSDILEDVFPFKIKTDYFTLSDIVHAFPNEVLGRSLFEKYGKMPLLIKINEAKGNSYQLHLNPLAKHSRWQPKAESWYYFEDGLITFGIKSGINLDEYKKTCLAIEKEMKLLSKKVITKEFSLPEAKNKASKFIKKLNPRQFVNLHQTKKNDVVDLSLGGIHHSWEEDPILCPKGNIVYEVQQDVMDPLCTIRSFDQGKFKDDGTVRKINIDDYFKLLDTDLSRNDLDKMRQQKKENNLLTTPFYSLDILEIKNRLQEKTNNSFVHLFVRKGEVEICAKEGSIFLSSGHSCFIPEFTKLYEIKTKIPNSVILKTYIS